MEALIHHFKIVSEGFRVPPGDVYQAVEGPRGELGYYVVSNGDNRPWRVRTRPPSLYNLQVLKKIAVGELIADMVVMHRLARPGFRRGRSLMDVAPRAGARLRPRCSRRSSRAVAPRCRGADRAYPQNALGADSDDAPLSSKNEGYSAATAMRRVADLCGSRSAAVESTVSFYTLFFRSPVGKYMLQPCRNLSCIIDGADEIMAYFRDQLGLDHLETSADGLFSYEEVECLAACDRAPCMQVNLEFVYDLTPRTIDAMHRAYAIGPIRSRRWRRRNARANVDGAAGHGAANPPGGTRRDRSQRSPAASATAAA